VQGVRWGGICEHGRIRSICKECGGSQICEHSKERKAHKCSKDVGVAVFSDSVFIVDAADSEKKKKKHLLQN